MGLLQEENRQMRKTPMLKQCIEIKNSFTLSRASEYAYSAWNVAIGRR